MNVIYQGLFLTRESEEKLTNYLIVNDMKPLERLVSNMHITFKFKPNEADLFPKKIMGKEFFIKVIGVGIENFSEKVGDAGERTVLGFKVQLPEELMPYYKGQPNIHITHSLGMYGKPIDCGKIKFEKIPFPFEIIGKMGFYLNTKNIKYS